jgi:hypothetical protein
MARQPSPDGSFWTGEKSASLPISQAMKANPRSIWMYLWWLAAVIFVLIALALFAFFVFSTDWVQTSQELPVAMQSPLQANYRVDMNILSHPPLTMKIIADTLYDRYKPEAGRSASDPSKQLATVVANLLTIVPTVTAVPTEPGQSTSTLEVLATLTATFTETAVVTLATVTHTVEVSQTLTPEPSITATATFITPSPTVRLYTPAATAIIPTRTLTPKSSSTPTTTSTLSETPTHTPTPMLTLTPLITSTSAGYPPPETATPLPDTATPLPPYP